MFLVKISRTDDLRPSSHFKQLLMGKSILRNTYPLLKPESLHYKLQTIKFLLCNNNSSLYGRCCSCRALLLLILGLHPLSSAQPGILLSGILSGNSTPSVKIKAQKNAVTCSIKLETQSTAPKQNKNQQSMEHCT